MTYDPEHYFPGEHELALVLECASRRKVLHNLHARAHRRSRLHSAGHNTLIDSYRGVVGRQVLELIDLGAELHGILTMPEFMGLKPEEVPTYEDSAGLQVAIDTANLFRECSPSDLLEFADSAPMKLDEEDPAMANMITMMTLTIHNNAPLSPRMVQKVKAGAAAMRAMERHAWRRHGGRVA